MKRTEYAITLTWEEAMNLVLAAGKADTAAWTPAAQTALQRATRKVIAVVPVTTEFLQVVGNGKGVIADDGPGRHRRRKESGMTPGDPQR